MAIAYMLSMPYAIIRPSICHTGGSVENGQVSIMQFLLYSSPISQVLWNKIHPEILTRSPKRGHQTRMGWGK